MKEDRIINALGQVKDEFILEAAPKAGREKRHAFRGLAAALAIVLLGALFFQTAPGAAAAEYVAEKVSSLIQTLFPPKEMSVIVEGTEVEGQYAAVGQEPEADETEGEAVPGFAIYIDTESYTMTEENGVTLIRPINFSPDLPAAWTLSICRILRPGRPPRQQKRKFPQTGRFRRRRTGPGRTACISPSAAAGHGTPSARISFLFPTGSRAYFR